MFRVIEYYISKLIKKAHLRAVTKSNVHFTSKICSGSHILNSNIEKYTDIGYDCFIMNASIGSFCSFGSNINIGGANHTIDWVSTSPVFNKNKDHLKKKFSNHEFNPYSKTIIGNDVWIANNVSIKAGINIGDGAVIGIGSVVTKNVNPYEIWAGNPAKLIRKRFSDDIIDELLKLKWWNLTDSQITEYAKDFNDPKAFIKKINSVK
jgi:acetyltransferase-like isoleucine patch superfamily enzyme